MRRHDTPDAVARALARWVRPDTERLLEPCVGTGALLRPAVQKLGSTVRAVVCVDTDADALRAVSEDFGAVLGRRLQVIEADFLGAGTKKVLEHGFDCILMNPPFAAKPKDWRLHGQGAHRRRCSIEVGFVLEAIRLLSQGGRLLAVVPASIISGSRARWLRETLLERGTVRYVHELPAYTFPTVEASVYLLVVEKNARAGKIVICNHRLLRPDRVETTSSSLGRELRLDYGYQCASAWHRGVRAALEGADWKQLSSVAEISRGSVAAWSAEDEVVHSTSFSQGFWWLSHRGDTGVEAPELLMTRVGRDCSGTVGVAIGRTRRAFTDCVIRIRPQAIERYELLFAIRCLLAVGTETRLLERGTGAAYIAVDELRGLSVPVGLHRCYPRMFDRYVQHIRKRNDRQMRQIEARVHGYLNKRVRRFRTSESLPLLATG